MRLSRKIFTWIAAIIIGIFGILFWMNNEIVYRYYLHEMKAHVTEIANEIMDYEDFQSQADVDATIDEFEEKYEVTIAYAPIEMDVDSINESIKTQLVAQNIPLNKFYLTQELIDSIKNEGVSRSIYNQGKVKYSLLCALFEKQGNIVVVSVVLVHDGPTIAIINRYYAVMVLFSLVVILITVWFLTRRITKPLKVLEEVAEDISNHNYQNVNIETGDEIEDLGQAIQKMSKKLEQAYSELNWKNKRLKETIANLSHELKTPVALIKAYAVGIEDGIDDGTYGGIISKHADRISQIIEVLLSLSSIEKESFQYEEVLLFHLIEKCIENHRYFIERESIFISTELEAFKESKVWADEEKLELVLNNLMFNAIKFTEDKTIRIELKEEEEKLIFRIKNTTSKHSSDFSEQLWEPFYVLENSRDKDLSGSGLGLSIVKSILEKHDCIYGYEIYDGTFCFKIEFDFVKLM